MNLKIAMLQLMPEKTAEEQLDKGIAACRKAKALGADIALFPEMWSNGYELPQEDGAINELAISADSRFVGEFRKQSAWLQMAIGITFLESHSPKPLNSMILFDRKGIEILHYSKVHTCAFDLEKVLASGDDFYVSELDIGRGIVKIGSMICFDRELPESAQLR